MEYHEIGEIFEHDGVLLEVVEYNEYAEGDVRTPCYMCFFNNKCTKFPTYCSPLDRRDREYAYYKLVEQRETDKNWQEANSKLIIPGGLAHLVREEERKEWDKLPLEAKCNKTKDMEQKRQIKVEGTDKVFATHVVNVQSDEEIYGSLLDKLFTTYKAKDADYGSSFAEMFDELGIDYAYGKLREKMNRIKVLRNKPNMVENEGLEDALLDTAGYAILTLVELKKRKR